MLVRAAWSLARLAALAQLLSPIDAAPLALRATGGADENGRLLPALVALRHRPGSFAAERVALPPGLRLAAGLSWFGHLLPLHFAQLGLGAVGSLGLCSELLPERRLAS